MSYSAGETLLLTALQHVANFSATNTDRGSWMKLNSGAAAVYAIIKPGNTALDDVNNFCWIHSADVQIWQWYTDDGTTATNLESNVAAVVDYITKHRLLGDTSGKIYDCHVLKVNDMQERWKKDGGLSWLSQSISVEWKEQDIVTYAE